MKLLPIFLLFLSVQGICQQGTISGRLIDSVSREPVKNATLYINQTQIIALSDSNGYFKIRLAQSPAELLITHVSYQKRALIVKATNDLFLIRLQPAKELMQEVTVSAKVNHEKDWKKWGSLFTEYFIGPGMERKCVLLNPEVVRFKYDEKQMILRAWAKKPLLVENKLLGYTIHVDLDSFFYSFYNTSFSYQLTHYFKQTKSSDAERERTLAANRLQAYGGSQMHFMRSVFSNTLEEQGFSMYKYSSRENVAKARVRQLVLQAQLNQGGKGIVDLSALGRDTMKYYMQVMAEPSYWFVDSLPAEIEQRRSMDTTGLVSFHLGADTLLLDYQPAANRFFAARQLKKWANLREPERYLEEVSNFLPQPKMQDRYSLLYMADGDHIRIQENGMAVKGGHLVALGFFSQRRMAYDLPWDYEPTKDYQYLVDETALTGLAVSNKITAGFQKIARNNLRSEVYLHLDKTTYDHNENIWFAAYVLQSAVKINEHKTLYVFLHDRSTGKKVTSQQFVMQDGYGSGYVFLADSLPGGDYRLVAYTNIYVAEQNPAVFEQEITLRPYATPFIVKYNESANRFSGDSVFITCKVMTPKNLYAAGANVSYQLKDGDKLIASGKQKVNDYGELLLKGLPLQDVLGKKLVLETGIGLKNENAKLETKLLVQRNFAKIKWYPEGGDLVDGLPCRLVFQLKDLNQKPLALAGNLLANGKPVGAFKCDASGIASIEFTPVAGNQYTVQLKDSITIIGDAFPAVLRDGYSISVKNGVIKDSLAIDVYSSRPPHTGYVMVHDYKTNYFLEDLSFKEKKISLTISAKDIAAGLATITVFNEKGVPVAERSIYKDPDARPVLHIELDSSSYGNRSKVVARIRATDSAGRPAQALFSLACILRKRIDTTRFQDIVSYNYLNSYRTSGLMIDNPNYLPSSEKFLEQFLLIQCWTRYGWQALEATPKDRERLTLRQKGRVLLAGNRIKKPVQVLVFNQDGFTTITTDAKGNFEVSPEVMTTQPDWKVNFAVNGPLKSEYEIVFENDNDMLQSQLAAMERPSSQPVIYVQEEENPEPRMLAPVTVKATLRAEEFAETAMTQIYSGNCTDYVCMYNILNCRNHTMGGDKPQNGQVYYRYPPVGNQLIQILYKGCAADRKAEDEGKVIFQLNGRYYTKQFYVADYAKNNPVMPEKYTTMYWNPLVVTNERGEAEVSFYTNDLSGVMLLNAQGVIDGAVLSGRKVFTVK